MKERPILFSAPMVRAILAGTKTQTRRVAKPQPVAGWAQDRSWVDEQESAENSVCPHGQPGDRLWVREAVALDYFSPTPYLEPIQRHGYRADWTRRAADSVPEPKWTPSIYMPRWASRITLELTEVRVQRLQDISEEDAKAEGVEASELVQMKDGSPCYTSPFQGLWRSIHGIDNPKAWDSNPWVWALTFKRVEAKECAA